MWNNARKSPVQADDVAVGLRKARREVDVGLCRSRWERATPAQRDMTRALARIVGDDAASVAGIAGAAGTSRTSDISVARNGPTRKGLACAPGRGLPAFTVPGMRDLVDRRP